MRIGTISPKRKKYHSIDVGIAEISFKDFENYGRVALILHTTHDYGLAQYPEYVVTLSGNEIKDLAQALKKQQLD